MNTSFHFSFCLCSAVVVVVVCLFICVFAVTQTNPYFFSTQKKRKRGVVTRLVVTGREGQHFKFVFIPYVVLVLLSSQYAFGCFVSISCYQVE